MAALRTIARTGKIKSAIVGSASRGVGLFRPAGLTFAYSETVLGAGVKKDAGTVETGVGTAERGAEKAG